MKHLILTLLLLAALPAAAQSSSDPEDADWYTVELVVFEQASDRSAPPPDPVVPDTANAVVLEERFSRSAAEDVQTGPLLPLPDALRFLPAPDGTLTLDEAYARLERSPRYRPILRMAWRQRVGGLRNPVPVRVQGGEELGRLGSDEIETALPASSIRRGVSNTPDSRAIREVDGTVALVRGRFLHLQLDLVFREPGSSLVTRGVAPAYGNAGPYARFPTWHIAERREIRPGELQYFDHRRFGVIAVATPWLVPEKEPAQPDIAANPRSESADGR